MFKVKTLLQINSVVNKGSTGRIAEEIGVVAIESGWKSYIAYGREALHSKSNLIQIGNDCDLKMHVIKTRFFDMHGYGSKKATINFIKSIKLNPPDLIIIHNIHGYYINLKILFEYLKESNLPIFWILYDSWAFTGHCTYFDAIGCSKWLSGCYSCPQLKEYPSSFFFDNSRENYLSKKELFTSLNNLTFITHSKWLRDLVKFSFLAKYKVLNVKNGINVESFQPTNYQKFQQKYNLINKFVLIGVAADWIKRKGFDDFIEIRKRLDENFIIILVGLKKHQFNLLPRNIIGIERVEKIEELAGLYSISNVFVNPTYEDNFPTTNLESLACGTPVITYNTGGSPEAIDNNTGIVVEKGDIDGLVQAILCIKEKGKSFYSDKCRERAILNFNKNDCFKEYINLFEEALVNNNSD